MQCDLFFFKQRTAYDMRICDWSSGVCCSDLVEFPSTLDEVFGVTNTKQSATIFSHMAQFDWKAEANPGESRSEFQERIQGEGDPSAILLPIVDHIRDQFREGRKRPQKKKVGRRTTDNKIGRAAGQEKCE